MNKSSNSQKSSNSTLKITKVSGNMYIVKGNSQQTVIEVFSQTHYSFTYTNKTGSTTTLDITSNSTETIVTINDIISINIPTNQSTALVNAHRVTKETEINTLLPNENTTILNFSSAQNILPILKEQPPALKSQNFMLLDESYRTLIINITLINGYSGAEYISHLLSTSLMTAPIGGKPTAPIKGLVPTQFSILIVDQVQTSLDT
jgi:hypothetical protein